VVADQVIISADRMSGYPLESDMPGWQTDLPGARVAPTSDGKRIIAATDFEIAALDLNGKIRWRAALPESVAGTPPDGLTVDDHLAYLTFEPRPERAGPSAVDTIALSIDD
jgi:hypothetical protein